MTRTAVVIGSPVEHSLSPVIHNAAFGALDLDWHYFALAVPDGSARHAIAAMRSLPFGGMSVTMPHKLAIAGLVDICTPVAAKLGAVNCVYWQNHDLVGDNTDGSGFVGALRHDEGFEPAGKSVVVVGAGGAARAVIYALAEAGVRDIAVLNRNAERAATAAELGGGRGRVVEDSAAAAALSSADLVVNATPVGMGDGALPMDPELLGTGQLLADLVYEPPVTPLVAAARARGVVAVNGLGMLIHQAAHAFQRWTGESPPVEVMSAAASAELLFRAKHR